ncbi:glycosyltransferase family 2 protein [Kineosporia sp. R_H_3]|uniref:glycosyltransferase n=1 Tax=Kineosporia sp. R_H_3 TaxID=1961848 RepID=UPI0018E96EC6|nr:glycosyltransferase [Kineosporia sp. R_H_3]
MTGPLRQMWAVVPAHDEAERLGRCLDALDRAVTTARAAGIAAGVVVVLDACTDGSQALCAGRPGVVVVRGDWRRVGAARAAGCARALDLAGRAAVPPDEVWLACTDADSAVPFDWLTHHARLADRGADAVRGTVAVTGWAGWPAGVAAAYRAGYAAGYRGGDVHAHVHGANLGVRGSAYLAAGGFPALACHEDVVLVDALVAGGAHVVATGHAAVRTSARARGRAPEGFSGHLRGLALPAGLRAPADGA